MSTYSILIRRRRFYYFLFSITPFVLGVLSAFLPESYILIGAGIYVAAFIIFSLFLYYSSVCPKCGGLFFGAVYTDEGIRSHRFFLNNSCNQCGYTEK
jgi:hypothetical protein